ncbi:hypothetical protein J6590_014217 [Homalodisca vitripennis]|nr:hypothetical protein J6590_014217 [Homalodisca vitripennis]
MFWGIVNELAGRMQTRDTFPIQNFLPTNSNITNDKITQVANDFNNYFASVGKTLADTINPVGDPVVSNRDYRLDATFTLHTVTELDIIRHMTNLRGGSAPVHTHASTEKKRSYIGTKIWNSLPEALKRIDRQRFRKDLRAWLQDNPFYSVTEFFKWRPQNNP